MSICNVVRIVLVTCELGAPTRWFNTVLISSIPAIISVGGELLRLDSWYFGLPSRLGVSSLLPSTLLFFSFALLYHGLLFSLPYVCVTNIFIGPINKR
jgi:hypothetical protein